MQGDSIEAANALQGWLSIYETHVCCAVNEQRGQGQQHLKTVLHGWCRKHNNTMPPRELLLALIQCNFAIQAGPHQTLLTEIWTLFLGGLPRFGPLLLAISATGVLNTSIL